MKQDPKTHVTVPLRVFLGCLSEAGGLDPRHGDSGIGWPNEVPGIFWK